MRYKDVEFAWDKVNVKFALIQWQGETKYVMAFFDRGKEGYDMRTVGARPFLCPDPEAAWFMASQAMAFLSALHEHTLEKTE